MDRSALSLKGTPRGAYGLRLHRVLPGALALLGEAPDDWPDLGLEVRRGAGDLETESVGAEAAQLRLQGGGSVALRRADLTAELTLPERPSDDRILHPFLAGAAGVAARWLDRDAFHAGGFTIGGGAWAVAGDKGAGKTSLLFGVTDAGCSVIADDLLVVDQGRVLAGPACLDLRTDAAKAVGAGEPLGVVGGRERWRVVFDEPAPSRTPLHGWVFPTWGSEVSVTPVPSAQRLPRIVANLALRLPPRSPVRILELASLPAFEFRRPRSWSCLRDSTTRLLEELAASR